MEAFSFVTTEVGVATVFSQDAVKHLKKLRIVPTTKVYLAQVSIAWRLRNPGLISIFSALSA